MCIRDSVHTGGLKTLRLINLDPKTTFEAASIDRAVATCRNLQVLEILEMHRVNTEGRDALATFVARALQENSNTLQELNLELSGFSAEMGEPVSQALAESQISQVKKLILSGNKDWFSS